MSNLMLEDTRQVTHLLVGVAAVALVQYVGFNSALLFMFIIFVFGLLLANFKVLRGRIKIIDALLELTDRRTAIPGQGAMFFAIGILLLLTFARPLEFGLGIVLLHAAGDAFATMVGLRFHNPLPWNNRKSWTGLAAFVVFGVIAGQFFIPLHKAILYSIVLGIVESLPLPIDDNVSVPMAALIFSFGGRA